MRDGDHYVINGTKTWITNARYANPLPVLVKTDPTTTPAHKGMSVLLVEAGTPGLHGAQGHPEARLQGHRVLRAAVRELPGARWRTWSAASRAAACSRCSAGSRPGRLNVGARALGVAQAAYDAALKYAPQREAFGKPIADFQAIQLKLAQMATQIQAARLLLYWAASEADKGERVDMQSGMAKLFASEVCAEVTLDAMRIHGGYGYSKEFAVERYYRDAPLMLIGEGTNDILRTVIARSLISGKESIG